MKYCRFVPKYSEDTGIKHALSYSVLEYVFISFHFDTERKTLYLMRQLDSCEGCQILNSFNSILPGFKLCACDGPQVGWSMLVSCIQAHVIIGYCGNLKNNTEKCPYSAFI